jgi:hypothetical protein
MTKKERFLRDARAWGEAVVYIARHWRDLLRLFVPERL